jgi:hypothetical protein
MHILLRSAVRRIPQTGEIDGFPYAFWGIDSEVQKSQNRVLILSIWKTGVKKPSLGGLHRIFFSA